MSTYVLVDTANTFFRARHVVRGDLDTKVGMALHITLNSIKKAWQDFDADHVVFCLEGRSWRKDYYEPYKRNRQVARDALTVKEAEEDSRFKMFFLDYLDAKGVYMDKEQLAVYKLPYYNQEKRTLEFYLNNFDKELIKNRVNLKRPDLVQKVQTILKAKNPGDKAVVLDSLLADVHLTLWKKHKPDFSNLFLNSGAHIQHHYLFNSKAYQGDLKNPGWYCPDSFDPLIQILSEYDKVLWEYLGSELKTSTLLLKLAHYRILLNFVIDRASRNKNIKNI